MLISFSVPGIRFDEKTSRIILELKTNTLKNAFTHKALYIGTTDEPHTIRQSNKLSRRDWISDLIDGVDDVVNGVSKAVKDVTNWFKDRFNDIKDDIQPLLDGGLNSTSLNFSLVNKSLGIPGDPFGISCNDCNGKGKLTFRTAKIEFNDPATIVDKKDLIKTGFVEIEVTDFATSIDLKATPKPKVKQDFTIFSFPFVGITVCIRPIQDQGVSLTRKDPASR